jgi:hypothetical protein
MTSLVAGAVIDRITLVVSDLDRAEEDYVRSFGCIVEEVLTSNLR